MFSYAKIISFKKSNDITCYIQILFLHICKDSFQQSIFFLYFRLGAIDKAYAFPCI